MYSSLLRFENNLFWYGIKADTETQQIIHKVNEHITNLNNLNHPSPIPPPPTMDLSCDAFRLVYDRRGYEN